MHVVANPPPKWAISYVTRILRESRIVTKDPSISCYRCQNNYRLPVGSDSLAYSLTLKSSGEGPQWDWDCRGGGQALFSLANVSLIRHTLLRCYQPGRQKKIKNEMPVPTRSKSNLEMCVCKHVCVCPVSTGEMAKGNRVYSLLSPTLQLHSCFPS